MGLSQVSKHSTCWKSLYDLSTNQNIWTSPWRIIRQKQFPHQLNQSPLQFPWFYVFREFWCSLNSHILTICTAFLWKAILSPLPTCYILSWEDLLVSMTSDSILFFLCCHMADPRSKFYQLKALKLFINKIL